MPTRSHFFVCRFSLLTIGSLIIISLIPSDRFQLLNRLTAVSAGQLLELFSSHVTVHGTRVAFQQFTAVIIPECTPLFSAALLFSFIIACPAPPVKRAVGVLAGGLFLFGVNTVRIAAVIAIGARFRIWFEVWHVYLGQIAMIIAVLGFSRFWLKTTTAEIQSVSSGGFLLKFSVITSVCFALWIMLNRSYISFLDSILHGLFSLFSYNLITRYDHDLYYQTFSLVVFSGLILSLSNLTARQRVAGLAFGIGIISLFQFAIRLGDVLFTALGQRWALPLNHVIYNITVFGLPLLLVLVCRRWFTGRAPAAATLGRRAAQT